LKEARDAYRVIDARDEGKSVVGHLLERNGSELVTVGVVNRW